MRRYLPIKGTYNIRDLGGYQADGDETQWRRYLRGDALHRIDQEGINALLGEGVATVIDLRRPDEIKAEPNPLQKCRWINYHNVPLDQSLMLVGPVQPLEARLIRSLEDGGPTIAAVMRVLSEARDDAVLFNCSLGKNRVGLISALLLANAGVDYPTICEDYSLTEPLIASVSSCGIVREPSVSTSRLETVQGQAFEAMKQVLGYLDERFGSPSLYLNAIGLDVETIARLQQRLLVKFL